MLKRLTKQNSKVFKSSQELIQKLKPNMTVFVGGFGLCGVPISFLKTLSKNKQINNLTVVSNDIGTSDEGLGLLLPNKQVKKMISSYIGNNKLFEKMYLNGDIEFELTP